MPIDPNGDEHGARGFYRRVVRVERVDTLADFGDLKAAWDRVYTDDPEGQFFLSWKWLAGVFEAFPGEWMVLVARDDDGDAVGFLPLHVTIVWSNSRAQARNELHFGGRLFWADYGGILCDPRHEDEVLPALAQHVKQGQWSHFYMKGLRISDRRYDAFMAALADERLIVETRTANINDGETDNLVAPYVELPDTFEAYLAGLSSNTRQKIGRFLRKMESSGYSAATSTEATLSHDLDALESLWHTMWSPIKGSEADRLAATYRQIVQRGVNDELAHLLVMRHQDRPVGVLASFVDREKSRLLFFVSGRDETVRDVPVGLMLHACNIRWAIEHGIRTYDFLRGDEPYKYSLGAADMRLRYLLVRTTSGTNLNGKLDIASIGAALDFARECVERGGIDAAATIYKQVLATVPEHADAATGLNSLPVPG